MKVREISTERRYELTQEVKTQSGVKTRLVRAIVTDNKTITLTTHQNLNAFVFVNSKPEMLKVIGELLIEASKLIKK